MNVEKRLKVTIEVEIEKTDSGLYRATCANLRGLHVVSKELGQVIVHAQDMLRDLGVIYDELLVSIWMTPEQQEGYIAARARSGLDG